MDKRAEAFAPPQGVQWPLATFIRSGFPIVTLSATRFLDCIRAAVRGQCLWRSCVGAGMVCPVVGLFV